MIRARLLVELPSARFRVKASQGRTPIVGDVIQLDQGFTSADGVPMVLGYCTTDSGELLYEAEIYESELGPNLASDSL
ncbi:MAG: hypothetical protein AAFR75_05045 [Pseudomonadota bacterium]